MEEKGPDAEEDEEDEGEGRVHGGVAAQDGPLDHYLVAAVARLLV